MSKHVKKCLCFLFGHKYKAVDDFTDWLKRAGASFKLEAFRCARCQDVVPLATSEAREWWQVKPVNSNMVYASFCSEGAAFNYLMLHLTPETQGVAEIVHVREVVSDEK